MLVYFTLGNYALCQLPTDNVQNIFRGIFQEEELNTRDHTKISKDTLMQTNCWFDIGLKNVKTKCNVV